MDTFDNLTEYLAAIVESSEDAIITKNLRSTIQTWNRSAERLFGYTAEEAIGQSIMMLIPRDRQDEEVNIIARLRRGERIQHFETVRRRKDNTLVPISLTISPVRDALGVVIGASKIARDISQQKEAAEKQTLLLAEMRHRVGNSFAVAGSLITATARRVESSGELAVLMRERLLALSSAHKLAVADPARVTIGNTSMCSLISTIMEPFAAGRQDLDIEDVHIAPDALTPVALILFELCTNAVKYGALGQEDGRIAVRGRRRGDRFIVDWQEQCRIDPRAVKTASFGTRMCQNVAETSLGGSISRTFEASGMHATIDLELAALED